MNQEYVFNCYVVRIQYIPTFDPPRYSVQIYRGDELSVEPFTLDANALPGQVLTAILPVLAALPPCP